MHEKGYLQNNKPFLPTFGNKILKKYSIMDV